MDVGGLRPVEDLSVASWIAPRLGPFGGWVGSISPRGFEAYARVLHPVPLDGGTTTWAAVCAATGKQPHALMQWDAIAGVVRTAQEGVETRRSQWDGGEPNTGNLEAGALHALVAELTRHTAADIDCFFALWNGYGWIYGSPMAVRSDGAPVPPGLPQAVLEAPRLRHPNREYLVFRGPLDALTTNATSKWMGRAQSPNLAWPADESWCVASEIDFDSTIVAGSPHLVDAVLASPDLEAWPVSPDDSLAYDGDTVNR
ncbi:MAG: hypothetical protein GEU80_08245 [Dehalococcoidia bacterium]|nr:hypothetical protein [Dehalococcoidia bacterium]